ncbi:unnamed protein product [Bursaphelenchus okinawaensis]|uniref:Vang-like protein n=1 Tax=Bursaphelenchus okinawaensis TaxID=465554 RepID=A0A811KLZ1_9BILA|nr:unnamed protein product [Bursaphelenchus okinawaensis]CAG9104984.1 unnamed protein product [Bursaphelenchus okinawaensis]
MSDRSYRHRPAGSSRGPRSVIGGGYAVDQAYLLPNYHFSALKSEGVKLNMPDDWGENTTIITSEQSFGGGPPERVPVPYEPLKEPERGCFGFISSCLMFFFTVWMVCSAIAMVVIPFLLIQADFYETKELQCELDCTTNIFVILIFTLILTYAVYATMKPTNAVLPRVRFRRVAFIFFLVFILSSFWLFYIVQALLRSTIDYLIIQKLAITLLFVLIILQILWITHDRLRRSTMFRVTITRDPDGEVHVLQLGQTSIQEISVEILRFYETTFSNFNLQTYRARAGASQKNITMPTAGFKLYDIDGNASQCVDEGAMKKMVEVAAKQSAALSSDYCMEEGDKERKLRRKKYRLLLSTEEAFAQIGSMNLKFANDNMARLDPVKSAKIVSGAIGKHLNRYLKHTHQQSDFPPSGVQRNLENCFRHQFSARTFLSRFFGTQRFFPSLPESRWTISSDKIVTQQIQDGTEFVLRCQDDSDGNIQLYCVVNKFSFYNFTESKCV